MTQQNLKLGAIYPDDMWIDSDISLMLDEFRKFLPEQVQMLSVRTHVPMFAEEDGAPEEEASVALGRWLAENGDIPTAAARLMRLKPNLFAYYCTTASFVSGVAGDEALKKRVEDATGLPCTTASSAIVSALRHLGVRRVATASPYMEDVNLALSCYLAECGIEVVNSNPLHRLQDHGIVPPSTIREAARMADVPEAEAVIISCTGQKTADFITDLEEEIGKPVVTSNQATGWQALNMLGVKPHLPKRGKLFEN
jgi:maleate isomerase